MKLFVDAPWYEDDRLPFNMFIHQEDIKEEFIQRLVDTYPESLELEVQQTIAEELGFDLDDLSDYELEEIGMEMENRLA